MVVTDKIGTIMTWEELLKEFPEKWVGLGDYVDDYDGISGRVICIFDDIVEKDRYMREHLNPDGELIHWVYTYDETKGTDLWQL